MTIASLAKTQTVLDFMDAEGGIVTFAYRDDADEEQTHLRRIEIPRSLWGELGNPDKITVSIEPGDLLNAARGDDNAAARKDEKDA